MHIRWEEWPPENYDLYVRIAQDFFISKQCNLTKETSKFFAIDYELVMIVVGYTVGAVPNLLGYCLQP